VVGIVLVDGSHPDQWERLAAVLPPPSAEEGEVLKRERRHLMEHPYDPQANPEGLDLAQSDAHVRAAGTLGALPLMVLSASQIWSPPGHTPDLVARMESVGQELQRKLATLSTHSIHIIANSGHFIQWEQPQVVIGAIRQLTDAARANTR
jgi:pimeloyl-ACP methyl ester carboxylesterase